MTTVLLVAGCFLAGVLVGAWAADSWHCRTGLVLLCASTPDHPGYLEIQRRSVFPIGKKFSHRWEIRFWNDRAYLVSPVTRAPHPFEGRDEGGER